MVEPHIPPPLFCWALLSHTALGRFQVTVEDRWDAWLNDLDALCKSAGGSVDVVFLAGDVLERRQGESAASLGRAVSLLRARFPGVAVVAVPGSADLLTLTPQSKRQLLQALKRPDEGTDVRALASGAMGSWEPLPGGALDASVGRVTRRAGELVGDQLATVEIDEGFRVDVVALNAALKEAGGPLEEGLVLTPRQVDAMATLAGESSALRILLTHRPAATLDFASRLRLKRSFPVTLLHLCGNGRSERTVLSPVTAADETPWLAAGHFSAGDEPSRWVFGVTGPDGETTVWPRLSVRGTYGPDLAHVGAATGFRLRPDRPTDEGALIDTARAALFDLLEALFAEGEAERLGPSALVARYDVLRQSFERLGKIVDPRRASEVASLAVAASVALDDVGFIPEPVPDQIEGKSLLATPERVSRAVVAAGAIRRLAASGDGLAAHRALDEQPPSLRGSAPYRRLLGQLFLLEGKTRDAVVELEASASALPVRSYELDLATALSGSERPADRDRAREILLRYRPGAPWRLWSVMADIADRTGDFETARELREAYYGRRPNDLDAALGLARTLYFCGEHQRAVELALEVARHEAASTLSFDAVVGIAKFLLGLNDTRCKDAAEHLLRLAAEAQRGPSDGVTLRSMRGLADLFAGRGTHALEAEGLLREATPDELDTWVSVAQRKVEDVWTNYASGVVSNRVASVCSLHSALR